MRLDSKVAGATCMVPAGKWCCVQISPCAPEIRSELSDDSLLYTQQLLPLCAALAAQAGKCNNRP
eukprot:1159408-Pelagomonas_calceolata.AAC.1